MNIHTVSNIGLFVCKSNEFSFLCGISPHFVSTGSVAGFVCIQEPSVCHVVTVRKREDPGNENECSCVAAITLITLLGCCHLANFDL